MSPKKAPNTKLAMPDPRPLIAAMGGVLVGGIMVATQLTQFRDLGWALITIAAVTAGWWTSEALRVAAYRRELRKKEERRSALQVTRKAKDNEERTRRESDRKSREEHALSMREQRAEEGRKRKEAQDAADLERAEREAAAETEVARLKSLDREALLAEVCTRMEARGLLVRPDGGDPNSMLVDASGILQAVLRMAHGRTANANDVRDIEAWRRDMGAPEAYLVCVRGFAPNAIRAAQAKPIVLVEPHLLAAWGMDPGPEN